MEKNNMYTAYLKGQLDPNPDTNAKKNSNANAKSNEKTYSNTNTNPKINSNMDPNPDIFLEEPYGEYDAVGTIIRSFKNELDERMEQMKIFSPYMDILRRNRNKEGEGYPIPELCMAVLTFLLYEGRLKFKGLLLQEIGEFLQNIVSSLMDKPLSNDDALSLAGTILDELQNNGANYIVRYYSFETGGYREKHVKLIEMKLSDENGRLYYHITKQGLDFYLKTKEFPEESQITINLLLFKMQLEKGAFQYALDTIKRLNMEVQRKLERKNYILGLLMAGGSEGSSAYRDYHISTLEQFKEESELFTQSRNLLQDTFEDFTNKLNLNTISAKEKKSFQMVKHIEKEMRKAIRSHESLLQEATSLVKEYDRILELRRKTAFTERFHFHGEFEKVVEKGLSPDKLKFLWEPLNKPFVKKSFNPLSIFSPQKISGEDDFSDNRYEDEIETSPVETIDRLVQTRITENFIIYAGSLLKSVMQTAIQNATQNAIQNEKQNGKQNGKQTAIQNATQNAIQNEKQNGKQNEKQNGIQNEMDIQGWCTILTKQFGSEAVSNGDFLSFLIVLNRGKLPGNRIRRYSLEHAEYAMEAELKTMEDVLYTAAKKYKIPIDGIQLEVESFEGADIDLGFGIKVTNMIFRGVQVK